MNEDEVDELEVLDILFEDLSIEGFTSAQMYHAYGLYLNCIAKANLRFNSLPININRKPSRNPICRGKDNCFEHIITRESKLSGRRMFDSERANRFHWIPVIIDNHTDKRIKYFQAINSDGENQLFLWYEKKDFLVIIREIKPNYLLITGYSVDLNNKNYYKKLYDDFKKK